MFDKIKRLFKHSVIYGLGDMGGRIVSFLLIPIVLRFLAPEDYGILEIFQVLKNLCLALLPLGLASSIFRYYFKARDPEEQVRVISNAFFLLLLISVSLFAAGMLGRERISSLLWGTTDFSLHVMVVSGTIALEIVKVVPFALLRSKERSLFYAVVQIIHILSTLTLNIVFLVVFKLGIMAILLGGLAGTVLTFPLLIPTFYRSIRLRPDRSEMGRLLRYGLPVAVGSVTFLLINSMDRFFIKHYCGMEELGIYALGFRFVSILTIFLINPFNMAWLPFALSIEKDKNAKEVYANVLIYFLFLGLFMALLITLFTPEVVKLISPQSYWGNYHFVSILCVAYLFFGLFHNIKIGIAIKEKTQIFLITSLCALGVNALLNMLLVPRFHLAGAAFSNLGAYLTLFGMTFYFSQRIYAIVYNPWRIFMLATVFGFILALTFVVRIDSLALSLLVKTGLLACFPTALLLLGFFTKSEIRRFKSLLGQRVST